MNVATPSALASALSSGLRDLALDITPHQQSQLLEYLALIQKWNKVYNLTAVRDPAEMLSHHLLDSLAVVAPLRRHSQGAALRLLDVGAGAGLPGVVIAICCPEVDVTCVDTVAKKAAFVQQAAGALALPNLRGAHARVEALAAAPFDVVTSRAFSSLADLVTLTAFHVKPASSSNNDAKLSRQTGVWMALKGKRPDDEIAALPPGVAVFHVEPLVVPLLDAQRCIVWMRPAVLAQGLGGSPSGAKASPAAAPPTGAAT